MIPGLGGDPRQMAMMMKKLGIDVQEIPDVQEVVIKTADQDYVFTQASVSVMKAQGVETWQLSGTPRVVPHGSDAAAADPADQVALDVSDDDVAMVAEQTGKDPAAARAALEAAGGDLAEAIVALSDD